MTDEAQPAPRDGRAHGEAPEVGQDEPGEWERMIAAFRTTAPRGGAPRWLEQRVMTEIESLRERTWWQRALGWLVRPTPVRVSPLAAGLALAGLAALLLLPERSLEPTGGSGGGGVESTAAAGTEPVIYVQFVLEAPTATSVAVAGDFSDWQPSFTLSDADGDGVWTGRVPVQPGVHGYMFLVDDTRWQTDPNADRYQDDGFGNRNAVLAVGASS